MEAAVRRLSHPVITFTALWLLLCNPAAMAATLEGVTLQDHLLAGNTRLVLNGMALRKKYFLGVYVGGLYLPQRNQNADDIIRLDAPRALTMQFVRDVGREKLVAAYTEGFSTNAAGLNARLKTDVDKFLAFLEDVRTGDRISFVYVPGTGSGFRLNEGKTLAIPGKDFADLYLLVYIGPHPPTDVLKKGLLGQ